MVDGARRHFMTHTPAQGFYDGVDFAAYLPMTKEVRVSRHRPPSPIHLLTLPPNHQPISHPTTLHPCPIYIYLYALAPIHLPKVRPLSFTPS